MSARRTQIPFTEEQRERIDRVDSDASVDHVRSQGFTGPVPEVVHDE